MTRDYIRDGAAIYAQSFATIRAEADLSGVLARRGARRGARDPRLRHGRDRRRPPLSRPASPPPPARRCCAGAPILCDAKMVAHGITRARLPAGNEVVCTLDDPEMPALAAAHRQHPLGGGARAVGRAAGAARWWRSATRRPRCSGCSNCWTPGRRVPAAIIGVPVGFVGAAESKEALAADGARAVPDRRGRSGGSAMAVAAVNALASERE